MKVHFQKARPQERGYVLLVLLLMIALFSIGLSAAIEKIDFQINRDREEEMIHRGVQYSRAVRLFYVRFKRFPASVEELENTNHIRFLRKRYKDPITGRDFKPLHMTEVPAFMQGGRVPALAPIPAVQLQNSNDGSKNLGAVPAVVDPADAAAEAAVAAEAAADAAAEAAEVEQQRKADPPVDPEAAAAAAKLNAQEAEADSAPPLRGVPIVGVLSLSKKKTIREFDKKDHYNQWLFIFNPNVGINGLITTPDQPSLLQRAAQAARLQTENSTERARTNPSE